MIGRLRQRGVGIIYISHHLAEVPLIADRVTVLRDGRLVAHACRCRKPMRTGLIGMMVGPPSHRAVPQDDMHRSATPVLEVEDLAAGGRCAA